MPKHITREHFFKDLHELLKTREEVEDLNVCIFFFFVIFSLLTTHLQINLARS